ncbi:hypothetical protein AGABI1DRAFT_127275 [Agaricus bisporus var. burnettii JB137-S8]|uniref:Uncharacterized protein n=1 Tax=Agaricus bisporus var. burnettii (strain JB137-S8 / ATCC MYA-4627 / FGSC 10392) TaxID=597362 RepID=K5XDM3_AGABU|nr:uncharacterized protein AGABI1DRAFT_127275 [Agaricus bisporus var. burnettii JB137-S8]EKM81262.1 hypothetical protein AGABI1DRAFT_127275 [Agaricus bisporus var. burnettii JB137-S8]
MTRVPRAWNDASREESLGPSPYQASSNQPFRVRTATRSHGIEHGEHLHRNNYAYGKAYSDAGSQPHESDETRNPLHTVQDAVGNIVKSPGDLGNASIAENIYTEGARTQSRSGTDQADGNGGYDPRDIEIPRRMPLTLDAKLQGIWKVAGIENQLRQQYILEQAEEITHESYELIGMKEDREATAYANVVLWNVGRLVETYNGLRRAKASNASAPMSQSRNQFEQEQKPPTTRHVPTETCRPDPRHPTSLLTRLPATDEKAITNCNRRNIKKDNKRAIITQQEDEKDDLPTNCSSPAIELANARLFEPKQDEETEEAYQRRIAAQKRLQNLDLAQRQPNLREELETVEPLFYLETEPNHVPQARRQQSSSNLSYVIDSEQSLERHRFPQGVSPEWFHENTGHSPRIKQESISDTQRERSKERARPKLPRPSPSNGSKGERRRETPPHSRRGRPTNEWQRAYDADEEIEERLLWWSDEQDIPPERQRVECPPRRIQPSPHQPARASPLPMHSATGKFNFRDYNQGDMNGQRDHQGMDRGRGIEAAVPNANSQRRFSIIPEALAYTTPGIADSRQLHKERMHRRLRDIIQYHLGTTMVLPEGYEPGPITISEDGGIIPYAGNPRFRVLERFVMALCLNFTLGGLAGPEFAKEQFRLLHLTQCVKGEAYRFVMRHVMNPSRQRRNWTFEEVIVALYERFIHYTSTHEARDNFRQTR